LEGDDLLAYFAHVAFDVREAWGECEEDDERGYRGERCRAV
jgi:hypothetical protein